MKVAGLAPVIFLGAARLLAHDFWIEPTSFRPEVGSEVGVGLRVGEHFRGDPVPRATEKIERFIVSSRSGERDVEGVPGGDPAGVTRVADRGYLVLGYRSRHSRVDLPADKFESYLKEEGLEKIVAARAARGQSDRPSTEIYSRCAKAILDAGGAGTAGYDRALGFRLELVPERSPKEAGGGRPMPVRLLYEKKPLPGALVVAMNRDEPEKRFSARTDDSGRVAFDLARGGVWLVKSVHMVPAPLRSGADWESLWASLTFEVP
jgi:uncharacterized GH25 family protein